LLSKLNIIKGIFAFIFVFFLFCYLPLNILNIIEKILPNLAYSELLSQLLSQIIHPNVPIFGFLFAIFVFLSTLSKNTKYNGIFIMLEGITSTILIYYIFQGGYIIITIHNYKLILDSTIIMLILIIPSILIFIKGLIITIKTKK